MKSTLPSAVSPTPPAVTIMTGPWTSEARQLAFDQAVHEHYLAYFTRAVKQRNWSPWHDLPVEEMRARGHLLSEDTANLIEGFMGVEEFVSDYVQEGLVAFRESRTRRNLHLQWGAEEARHGVAWELLLKHSNARTETQLTEYLDKIRDSRWQPQQHAGVESPLATTIYAMIQERATFYHYQEVRARVRAEYGLPPAPTPEERQRGYEIGASEACRLVTQDELAHHSLFLHIVRSALKYFPSLTCDTLTQVFAGFSMPALRFIPKVRTYLRSVKRTNLYSEKIHEEKVHKPVLNSLGLEDQQAFEHAARCAHALPEHFDPEEVRLRRSGEWQIAAAHA
ncbi:MAG: acyl-ACP desaturase [Deltaproteobacteria bacterium]|nr:acyl-ACP desaturase [Deltaproteobacteria bacterium]